MLSPSGEGSSSRFLFADAADFLADAGRASHLGDSQSLFVNASTWGLVLTGCIIRLDDRPAVGGNASLLAME